MRLRLIVLGLVLVAASAPAAARADAPGPRWVCGVTGLGCTACSHASAAGYDACAAGARAGGLVPACEDVRVYGEGFSTQHFCPKGTRVELVPEAPPARFACSRCSAAGDASPGSAGLVAAAMAVAFAARRRGRGRDRL